MSLAAPRLWAKRLATPIPMRSASVASRSRFRSGSKRFAACQGVCKHVVEADLAVRDDLTLMTSVTSLRSSISWNRFDHKLPFGPCSKSPLCMMPLVTYFAPIGILIFASPSTGLRIWIAPTVRLLEPSVCLVLDLPRNQCVTT